MTNKERLELNNAKIEEITKTLKRKQVSPTDMLQAMVDGGESCAHLCYVYRGDNLDFIKNLDTSKATSMYQMFYNCEYITSLDVSNFNTSNVTDMDSMFYGCKKLASLDLSSFNTSEVTRMYQMFTSCYGLTELDLSNFNTEKVTSMAYMFSSCDHLISVNVSNFNTANVTSFQGMFSGCNKLTSLDLSSFDTSKVTNMSYMFSDCNELVSIDLSSFNTSSVKGIDRTFRGCYKLETIQNIDLRNSTGLADIVQNCKALTNLYFKNIKVSLKIGSGTSYGTLLTDDSIVNTFKELWDLTGSTSQTLTLSYASGDRTPLIYVKLIDITDEMRTEDPYIDNKKPCVVCEPTDEGAMTLKEYGISKNWNISY
jgi:surface protein